MNRNLVHRLACCLACLLIPAATLQAQDENAAAKDASQKAADKVPDKAPEISYEHRNDPEMYFPPDIPELTPEHVTLWMSALKHDEIDLQREILASLLKVQRGKNVDLTTHTDTFVKMLQGTEHLTLRISLAQLLVELDAKSAADTLFKLLESSDTGYAAVVEPALAKWKFDGAQKMWQDRLSAANVPRARRRLACECLAELGAKDSVDALLAIVKNTRAPSSDRFTAARAVGQLSDNPVPDARAIAKIGQIIDRLAAVQMLQTNDSAEAASLLVELCGDKVSAVAGNALQRLLEIDKPAAAKQAFQLISTPDPKVRELCVTALFETPDTKGIGVLGNVLADHHPDVRKLAQNSLYRLASQSEEFSTAVRAAGMKALDGETWQGLEQACILIGALKHKPAADRLLAIMEQQENEAQRRGTIPPQLKGFQRAETRIAVGWALKELAIPDTYPVLLARADRVVQACLDINSINGDQKQIGYFFEAFGRAEFRAAEKLMRKLVSDKQHFEPRTRAAAIWALGLLFVDNAEPTLTSALIGRINDQGSIPPESVEVHEMSAVALGRMKAKNAVGPMKKLWDGRPPQTRFSYGIALAVEQITGEKTARPVAIRAFATGFNLEPLPDE